MPSAKSRWHAGFNQQTWNRYIARLIAESVLLLGLIILRLFV
jgi:hypothetical protein